MHLVDVLMAVIRGRVVGNGRGFEGNRVATIVRFDPMMSHILISNSKDGSRLSLGAHFAHH